MAGRSRGSRWMLLLFSAVLSGCTGLLSDDAAGSGPGPGGSATCPPARSPLRRLTHFEYNNTVRDLLGDVSRPADAFPAEEIALGFNNNADALVVGELLAEYYLWTAEALARQAVTDLPSLLACAPAQEERACVEAFVGRFGRRAYRRPVPTDEIAGLMTLFDGVRAELDLGAGVEALLQAMLQSPSFLYRVELGAPAAGGPAVPLTSFEVATRLSYLLWASMPDDELLDLAEAGGLGDADAIESEARRMLAHPRAREALADFHRQWLELDRVDQVAKDPAAFPEVDEELITAWKRETEMFVDHVLWEASGTAAELISAPYSFVNGPLAQLYGVAGPTGEAFVKVTLDPAQRAGFLTQASFLATQAHAAGTSPVHRGLFVREKILCQDLPPPPAIVEDIVPPVTAPDATLREQLEALTDNDQCSSCHALINPIGFAFESYDAVGAFRTVDEAGHPVVTDGELVGTSDIDGPFAGALDLIARLSSSRDLESCVVLQWFRFGYGREEQTSDQCTMDGLAEAFAASDGDIRELLVAITRSDAFRFRTPGE